jgi:biopolymer transport protein ExbD
MVSLSMKAASAGCAGPTPGECLNLWQNYGYELSIGEIWGGSDGVERLIFIALALMLGYTVFVVVRFSPRYLLSRREFLADSTPAAQRDKKNFVADLSRGVGTLRSIAAAAPFLGLAGTCYGILSGFHGMAMEIHSALGMMVTTTAATLVTTVAGIVVAVPAAVSYNVLRTHLGKFESSTTLHAARHSYGCAQTLPLQSRFSRLPAFALIGAPVLAILIPMFALMDSRRTVGLPVQLLKIGMSGHNSAPIVISVLASGSGQSFVFVNSKETPWEDLRSALRTQLEVRPRWIVYVEADSDASWRDAAYVIDVARGLHAEVVLVTTTPKIGSDGLRKAKTKRARDQR